MFTNHHDVCCGNMSSQGSAAEESSIRHRLIQCLTERFLSTSVTTIPGFARRTRLAPGSIRNHHEQGSKGELATQQILQPSLLRLATIMVSVYSTFGCLRLRQAAPPLLSSKRVHIYTQHSTSQYSYPAYHTTSNLLLRFVLLEPFRAISYTTFPETRRVA
jgi:hypothetical protein